MLMHLCQEYYYYTVFNRAVFREKINTMYIFIFVQYLLEQTAVNVWMCESFLKSKYAVIFWARKSKTKREFCMLSPVFFKKHIWMNEWIIWIWRKKKYTLNILNSLCSKPLVAIEVYARDDNKFTLCF